MNDRRKRIIIIAAAGIVIVLAAAGIFRYLGKDAAQEAAGVVEQIPEGEQLEYELSKDPVTVNYTYNLQSGTGTTTKAESDPPKENASEKDGAAGNQDHVAADPGTGSSQPGQAAAGTETGNPAEQAEPENEPVIVEEAPEVVEDYQIIIPSDAEVTIQ